MDELFNVSSAPHVRSPLTTRGVIDVETQQYL